MLSSPYAFEAILPTSSVVGNAATQNYQIEKDKDEEIEGLRKELDIVEKNIISL